MLARGIGKVTKMTTCPNSGARDKQAEGLCQLAINIIVRTTVMLLRREKSFCKIFREVFRSFCEVFQSFRKFFEVFVCSFRLLDPFGPIGMHSDAFGSNWKRLDVFEIF